MIEIRKEKQGDSEAIHHLHLAAFPHGPEADLVDKLRVSCEDYLSFVAAEDSSIVGHILFTPVTLTSCPKNGMGLAPMAVMPSHQRQGIGSALVNYGLEFLAKANCPFISVLGHPEYYPRFGFECASKYGLLSQWEGVPDEAFMAVIFEKRALPESGGTIRYPQEFNDVM